MQSTEFSFVHIIHTTNNNFHKHCNTYTQFMLSSALVPFLIHILFLAFYFVSFSFLHFPLKRFCFFFTFLRSAEGIVVFRVVWVVELRLDYKATKNIYYGNKHIKWNCMFNPQRNTHDTHTHTHATKYIYIHINPKLYVQAEVYICHPQFKSDQHKVYVLISLSNSLKESLV